MALHIDSNALYLSAPYARSHAGGHFFFSDMLQDLVKPEDSAAPPNGPIHSVCEMLCNIMASATKAEVGALYTNTRKGEEFCTALQELSHLQPSIPIMTDNTTANEVINDTIKQQRSCAIHM
eukprot:6598391-Ditylum_brightwellii.AAC.1